MKLEIVNQNGATEPDGAGISNNTSKRLRGLAVVGLGYWGPNWIRNFYTLQCAERLVACDLSTRERLRRMSRAFIPRWK